MALEEATLVTGAHTGLANLATDPPRAENAHLRGALRAQRVRFVACDASRAYPLGAGGALRAAGTPFPVGSAFAVPRHPTVLPHDAVTPSQVLDRLRTERTTSLTSFAQVTVAEAARMLATALANDPCPHYFHQSNLIGSDDAPGIIYPLLDAVLERYRAHLADDAPLLQPSLGESGRILLRRGAWRAVERLGSIEAWREGQTVEIVNRSPSTLELPLTGTSAGERYAGTRSGWLRVAPGATRLDLEA